MTKPIKLTKLIELLRGCYDRHKDNPQCADNIEVEFWRGDELLALDGIGQFSVKPDVTINFKPPAALGE